MLTLLQMVQAACNELGLPAPSVVASSTDLQVKQLYALTNRDCNQVYRDHNWTKLTALFTLNVGAPIVTTGTTANNSNIITGIPSTTNVKAGIMVVTGTNIPVAARVVSVDSATQITMDMYATGNAAATAITFAQDTYPEPTDFDRFINRTGWDRTNRWELLGPASPQLDQWHQSGIVTTGPRRFFRQIGNLALGTYRIWPPPQNVGTPFQLVQEYISKNWCQSVTGTPQSSFLADSDTPILDDQMIILGIKWRMWQIKGFDYAALQAEYLDYVQITNRS